MPPSGFPLHLPNVPALTQVLPPQPDPSNPNVLLIPGTKLIGPGNVVRDITTPADCWEVSLAQWVARQPLEPHRCESEEWYVCMSGNGHIFVEGKREPNWYDFQPGSYVHIPERHWAFSIPAPGGFYALIYNKPAFEPEHFKEVSRAYVNHRGIWELYDQHSAELFTA